MAGIPKTRTFNGKQYKLEEVYVTENAAYNLAERIRAQGDRARVVKHPLGFAVYYNKN
jgi:TolB-like protein